MLLILLLRQIIIFNVDRNLKEDSFKVFPFQLSNQAKLGEPYQKNKRTNIINTVLNKVHYLRCSTKTIYHLDHLN